MLTEGKKLTVGKKKEGKGVNERYQLPVKKERDNVNYE